jgi:CubicO group peptidase (beta-lactamase class C family)
MLEPADGPYHRAGVSDGLDQPGLSAQENLRRIASVPLLFEPGSGWQYSVAYDVLGSLLERAVGKPLPEIFREVVLGPLSMTGTGFHVSDTPRLASPYWAASSGTTRMKEQQEVPFAGGAISFAPHRVFDSSSYPSGGSGLVGTASDFLRLLEAVRNGGSPVLSPQSVELLSNIATGNLRTLVPGSGWSLGWCVLRDPSQTKSPQTPGTWMWGGVYGCFWFVDPARALSVAVLTNTAVVGMLGPFPDAVRDAIYSSVAKDSVPSP